MDSNHKKFNLLLTITLIFSFFSLKSQSIQTDTFNINILFNQQARQAVSLIMQYTGLPQNFEVSPEKVHTAVAYIKNKKRLIAYNESFMTEITEATKTNWAAISILAHEIGHHLAGHTLDYKSLHPSDELEADLFSGYILGQMGASLEDALAAMQAFQPDTSNKRHPNKEARLMAISEGWHRQAQIHKPGYNPFTSLSKLQLDSVKYMVQFKGDHGLYFIHHNDLVYWLSPSGTPIQIGHSFPSEKSSYLLIMEIPPYEPMGIDVKGDIWETTMHGAMHVSGRIFHPGQ